MIVYSRTKGAYMQGNSLNSKFRMFTHGSQKLDLDKIGDICQKLSQSLIGVLRFLLNLQNMQNIQFNQGTRQIPPKACVPGPSSEHPCPRLSTQRQMASSVYNISVGLDNGLAPNRRQTIIWNNDGLVYWRIYASLGLDELNLQDTQQVMTKQSMQLSYRFSEKKSSNMKQCYLIHKCNPCGYITRHNYCDPASILYTSQW